MKTALKWIGYSVLGLIALVALMDADKLTQWFLMAFAGGSWAFYTLGKAVDESRRDLVNRVERLYDKVEQVAHDQWRAEKALTDVARAVAALTTRDESR